MSHAASSSTRGGPGPSAVTMAETAHPVAAMPMRAGQMAVAPPGPYIAGSSEPPPAFVPDAIEDHIMRPNAFTVGDIVNRVNGQDSRADSGCANAMCCMIGCCGLLMLCSDRCFRTGVGLISLWLDTEKRPLALEPNSWQCRPNLLQEKLGTYDMASSEPFAQNGVCILKIEVGSVYFAHLGGQPVMIAAKEKPGWFVTVDPGFSFARQILVDGQSQYNCRAKLSSSYINFESLHLFNVQPNTVHVVSKYEQGIGNQWQVLPPGAHSFSSAWMRSTAVIPTSIQDVIIGEDRVSTQDGIGLSNCKAVLSYQIRLENVHKLLDLDVQNYKNVIEDWAKRTMLHEIGNTDYQSHSVSSPDKEADGPGAKQSPSPALPQSSSYSVLGGKGGMPGTGGRDDVEGNFRPTLEHHMRRSLELSLVPYGVQILTFALQSFDPPLALANQVTAALARRTEAQYQFQAAMIQNQTLVATAEAEAQAIQVRAHAVHKAAQLTAATPHACRLQILDKEVEIARAWSGGNARTLVLQQGGGGGGGAGNIPFTSLSELSHDNDKDAPVSSSSVVIQPRR